MLHSPSSSYSLDQPLTRRRFLQQATGGLVAAGLPDRAVSECAHTPNAQRLLILFNRGGVSAIDTFDPKPLLQRYDGQPLPPSFGIAAFAPSLPHRLMPSARRFMRCGQSGVEIATDLFPHLSRHADELAIIRSLTSDADSHALGRRRLLAPFLSATPEGDSALPFAMRLRQARRDLERGATCRVVFAGSEGFEESWDGHQRLDRVLEARCAETDRPMAELLTDLKSRGMLETTLVVWLTEFGRTPTTWNGTGRDHNPHGFSVWLAGGGVRGGMVYGATDEFGVRAVENPVTVDDLHATIFHLWGGATEALPGRPHRALFA